MHTLSTPGDETLGGATHRRAVDISWERISKRFLELAGIALSCAFDSPRVISVNKYFPRRNRDDFYEILNLNFGVNLRKNTQACMLSVHRSLFLDYILLMHTLKN